MIIRDHPKVQEICPAMIILVTADTRQKTKAGAMSIGIDYFIQKPFSLKLIRELLQEIIDVHEDI